MIPEWCSDKVWGTAMDAYPVTPYDPTQEGLEDIARALLEAEQRGRREGMEEAAKVLGTIEPDEEAAGCDASWGDFVQLSQAAIRAKIDEVQK